MKKNKYQYQQGFAVSSLIAVVSLVSLFISGTKVTSHVYEKNETEKIANQFEEQAQRLADRAKDMGKSGDEAVKESLRLHQAAKDIRQHGTLVYQQKMVGEAVSMTKSLVVSQGVGAATEGVAKGLGATAKTAEELSKVSGAVLDADAIEQELQQAEKVAKKPVTETKEGKKLNKLIKDSRKNVDDFNLAQVKAMTDELINMRQDLEKMGSEIEDWIAIREQAEKDLERAAYHRRLKQRERARLAVLENDDLNQIVQQDFAGEETVIDVVKEMSGHSLDEWGKIKKDVEKKAEEAEALTGKTAIGNKIKKKQLDREKVEQAIKKAQQELGWPYYDFDPTNQSNPKENWMIDKKMDFDYHDEVSAFRFVSQSEYQKWKNGYCQEGYIADTGSRIKSFDVGDNIFACCISSKTGGGLRMFPQSMWYINAHSGDKSCARAFEYLKVFWKYLD